MPLWKQLTLGQIISLHIEMGRNVHWKKSIAVLVSQTQYPVHQPGKNRRHCTSMITQISFCSAVIQMLDNHLTSQVESHSMQHHGDGLKLLQGNMSPTHRTRPESTN